ncbi:hypothetical protein BDR26DRAFT_842940 [Obelidium mucronatum]|nr:hypothetical protein BDR26DRAFT_842940 [Obelidium mucronatum]
MLGFADHVVAPQISSTAAKKKYAKLKKSLKPQPLDVAQIARFVRDKNAAFKAAIDACPLDYPALETLVAAKHKPPAELNSCLTSVDGGDMLLGDDRNLKLDHVKLDLASLLANLKTSDIYHNQIQSEDAWKILEQRNSLYGNLTVKLSPELSDALFESQAVVKLYAHQAAAINAIDSGSNVIVSTATASGKSLIYQIPVLRQLELNVDSRAIFIFPTKALAQDQKRSLSDVLANHTLLRHNVHENEHFISTYDGDTPFESCSSTRIRGRKQPTIRDLIRETCRVMFTNFDTLHKTFARHKSWIQMLTNLKIVVVDELHCYSGRFGMHCSLVMMRLKRLCAHYGNTTVRFISCSATIANPVQHMSVFFGIPPEKITLVNVDGSPAGKKHQIVWNPPPVDGSIIPPPVNDDEDNEDKVEFENPNVNNDDMEIGHEENGINAPQPPRKQQYIERVAPTVEAVNLCMEFLKNDIRFICFVKNRRTCETVLKEFYDRFEKTQTEKFRERVMSYRGGYSREDRREIERKMFDGKLFGIIATSALELGVDIGTLDVVLHLGYPRTMASYRQQLGRAGRRRNDSASIMIADGRNRVDQHFVKFPNDLFDGNPDTIHLPFSNTHEIVNLHLHCAAAELAMRLDEYTRVLSTLNIPLEEFTTAEPALLWDPIHQVYFAARQYEGNPAKSFQVRESEEEEDYRVIDVRTNQDVEFVEFKKAFMLLYDGAIFLHRGQSYFILDVDHAKRISRARTTNVSYITKIRDYKLISPHQITNQIQRNPTTTTTTTTAATMKNSAASRPITIHRGLLKVTTISTGYFKLDPRTQQKIEAVDMGNETNRIESFANGFWWEHVCGGIDSSGSGGNGGGDDGASDVVANVLRKNGIDLGEAVHAAGHAIFMAISKLQELEEGLGAGGAGIEAHCAGMYGPGPKSIFIYVSPFSCSKSNGEVAMRRLWSSILTVLDSAVTILEACSCEAGCSDCIIMGFPKCKAMNSRLNRKGGILVLKTLLPEKL